MYLQAKNETFSVCFQVQGLGDPNFLRFASVGVVSRCVVRPEPTSSQGLRPLNRCLVEIFVAQQRQIPSNSGGGINARRT
jgi:hypothetical protein